MIKAEDRCLIAGGSAMCEFPLQVTRMWLEVVARWFALLLRKHDGGEKKVKTFEIS